MMTMTTPVRPVVTVPTLLMTPAELKTLTKLLHNAWAAEYALRITPVVTDEAYQKNAYLWTFPQVYYSTLFSTRALLYSLGQNLSNEAMLGGAAEILADFGYYDDLQEWLGAARSPLALVHPYRISSTVTHGAGRIEMLARSIEKVQQEQARLVAQVEAIARCHERHIIRQIGVACFKSFAYATSAGYVRDLFLRERFNGLVA